MNSDHIQSLYNKHQVSLFSLLREADRKVNIKSAGTSMYPLIQTGDELSLRLKGTENIRIGDVAAFFQNQITENNQSKIIIVHRIVKKKKINGKSWYCQKGDNVSGWGWIAEEDLIGIVESVNKKGKSISLISGHIAFISRIIGFAGWLLVTFTEKIHPVISAAGYHPSKDFPKIREKTICIINKILQKCLPCG